VTFDDQDRFLADVRRALGVGTPREAPPGLFQRSPSPQSRELLERVRRRAGIETQSLMDRLQAAASPLKIDLHCVSGPADATAVIAQIAAETSPEWGDRKEVVAWRHPLVESLRLSDVLDVPVFFSEPDERRPPAAARRQLRRRLAKSAIGVTAAEFCLADTATVVLRTRPGQARGVSLLPSVHVAVIESSRLIADLAELYALLRWHPAQRADGLSTCLALISGPSKTADIEATLVHGAHGPGALHLIVVDRGKNLDSGS
jgi:L-lactate dehydrogenase complex protein LldG